MKMVETYHPPLSNTSFNTHRTLVLNGDYKPLKYPLEPLNGEDTIKGMFLERFEVVEWSDTYAHSPSLELRLPSVVALRDYIEDAGLYGVPTCNLYNLYVRDIGLCQYTGVELKLNGTAPANQASIDHVNPRKFGGKVEWLNAVLASQKVNNQKGARTPEQAGLPLRVKPWVPRGADLLYLWLTKDKLEALPQAWREFLQIRPTPALRRVLEQIALAA